MGFSQSSSAFVSVISAALRKSRLNSGNHQERPEQRSRGAHAASEWGRTFPWAPPTLPLLCPSRQVSGGGHMSVSASRLAWPSFQSTCISNKVGGRQIVGKTTSHCNWLDEDGSTVRSCVLPLCWTGTLALLGRWSACAQRFWRCKGQAATAFRLMTMHESGLVRQKKECGVQHLEPGLPKLAHTEEIAPAHGAVDDGRWSWMPALHGMRLRSSKDWCEALRVGTVRRVNN